jgi:ribosomal protein S14
MPTPPEPRDRTPGAPPPPERPPHKVEEECDVCGSTDVWWRNCKLLCRNCGAIVKSCADL